jgi:sec-independent protein translocase protein TatA
LLNKKTGDKNMGFGMQELLLTLGVIIFGGRKIPELARGMGQAVREFRKSIKEMREEIKSIGVKETAVRKY